MKTFVKKVFFPLIMFLASTKIAFAPIQGLTDLTRTQGAVSANLQTILDEVRRLKNNNNALDDIVANVLGIDNAADLYEANGNLRPQIGQEIDNFKQNALQANNDNAQLRGLLAKAQNDAAQADQAAQGAIAKAQLAAQQNQQLTTALQAEQQRATQLTQELTDVQTDLANRIAEEAGQNDVLLDIADVLYPDGRLSRTLQPTPQ